MARRRLWPRHNRIALFAGLVLALAQTLTHAPVALARDVAAASHDAPEIAQPDLLAPDLAPDELAPDELALMGTIPIYWGETAGFGELLDGAGEAHWAREAIEQRYHLRPLDYLSAQILADHSRLLLAQPRGFSAEENVALDEWVRGGGHVLLFADPQMTGDSRFSLGDRRRPQDIALLSPILSHWGLELSFDEHQNDDIVLRDLAGVDVPTRLSGHFSLVGEGEDCAILAAGLVAQCRLGSGFALIFADAAMLDLVAPAVGSAQALDALLQRAFGDCAGYAVLEGLGERNNLENKQVFMSATCGPLGDQEAVPAL